MRWITGGDMNGRGPFRSLQLLELVQVRLPSVSFARHRIIDAGQLGNKPSIRTIHGVVALEDVAEVRVQLVLRGLKSNSLSTISVLVLSNRRTWTPGSSSSKW